jgi:hypothetical protein
MAFQAMNSLLTNYNQLGLDLAYSIYHAGTEGNQAIPDVKLSFNH